mmetsp:Transcript_32128/g.64510  ORF Transcript_32128/g.64510 Transcript_32128/m.64510 type:complete len:80 (-) Transcript_32128:30-269(-)
MAWREVVDGDEAVVVGVLDLEVVGIIGNCGRDRVVWRELGVKERLDWEREERVRAKRAMDLVEDFMVEGFARTIFGKCW